MSVRFIERVASVAIGGAFRLFPKAIPFVYDNTTGQLKFLDQDGAAIRTIEASAAPSVTTAAAVTVAAADRGRMFIDTQGAATTTYTLPTAASMPGAEVTFICGSAAGEILVNPNAADQISMKGLIDNSTSVKPAAGTGVKNTAATNVLGDYRTFRSDGVNTWHQVSGAGIWASQ